MGFSGPRNLKPPEPTMPTPEELALESQKAVAEQKMRDKRRKGIGFTLLTGQGKTLLGG